MIRFYCIGINYGVREPIPLHPPLYFRINASLFPSLYTPSGIFYWNSWGQLHYWNKAKKVNINVDLLTSIMRTFFLTSAVQYNITLPLSSMVVSCCQPYDVRHRHHNTAANNSNSASCIFLFNPVLFSFRFIFLAVFFGCLTRLFITNFYISCLPVFQIFSSVGIFIYFHFSKVYFFSFVHIIVSFFL